MKSSMNERRFFIGGTFGNPMSWRFIPKIDPETGKEVVEDAEKDFDKERQQRDQDAANQRKYQEAQAEADEARQEAQRLAQEKAELEQKLADAQLKAEEEGVVIPELDENEYQDTDVPIVKAIKGLQKALDAKDKRIKNLEKVKDDLLKERQEDAEKAARNKVYDGLLDDLDAEYGAQHRNAAVAAFDKLLKAGEVPKGNPAKATRIMEKCYKDVAAAAKKSKSDDSVNLDSGTGGNAPGSMSTLKLKPGSLEEVEAQVAAAINTT